MLIEEYKAHKVENRPKNQGQQWWQQQMNMRAKFIGVFATYVKYHREAKRWSEIRTADVQAYIEALKAIHETPYRIKKRIADLSDFFDWLQATRGLKENPASGLAIAREQAKTVIKTPAQRKYEARHQQG